MGLVTKSVKISPRGKTATYYRSLGYQFESNNEIEVKIEDLSKTSKQYVECTCDYCNEKIFIQYASYNRSLNSPTHKVACSKCSYKKIAECNMILYGVRNPSMLTSVKEKVKATNRAKFGYDNVNQSPKTKEKRRNNLILKYGKPSCYTEQVKEKVKQTNRERRGVDFPTQAEDVKRKVQSSVTLKFGVENISQSSEIKKKKAETLFRNSTITTSKQQRYIHNLLGGTLNGIVSHYNCDIVFYDEKIIVECDFSGHNLNVKLGEISEEEFKQKEIIRSSIIKRAGFKIIRIISRKNYLPSDTILLQMLQYARDFFTQNPQRSWISFDIDNSCIYNAYHKESTSRLPYDYGKLRKIKKEHLSSHSSPTPQTLLQPSAQ